VVLPGALAASSALSRIFFTSINSYFLLASALFARLPSVFAAPMPLLPPLPADLPLPVPLFLATGEEVKLSMGARIKWSGICFFSLL